MRNLELKGLLSSLFIDPQTFESNCRTTLPAATSSPIHARDMKQPRQRLFRPSSVWRRKQVGPFRVRPLALGGQTAVPPRISSANVPLQRHVSCLVTDISHLQDLAKFGADEALAKHSHSLTLRLDYSPGDWQLTVQLVNATLANLTSVTLESLSIDVLGAPVGILQNNANTMFKDISLQSLLRFSTNTLPHLSIAGLLRRAVMLHNVSLGPCLSGTVCPLGVLRNRKIKNVRCPSACISQFAPDNPLNNVAASNTRSDEQLATFTLFQSLRMSSSAISSLRVNIACVDMGVLFDLVTTCPLLVRLCLEETVNMNTCGSVRRPWNFGEEWSRRLAQLPRLTTLSLKTCAPTLTIFGERLLENWFQSPQAISHPSLLSITVWQTGRGPAEDVMMAWHRNSTGGDWGDCAMDTPGIAKLLFL